MICDICQKDLSEIVEEHGPLRRVSDDDGTVRWVDGRNVMRHIDNSPERIAGWQEAGAEASSSSHAAKELGNALCDLLIPPDHPKAEAYALVLHKLAKSKSDKSIELAMRLLGMQDSKRPDADEKIMAEFRAGKRACPTCGEWPGVKLNLSKEVVERMLELGVEFTLCRECDAKGLDLGQAIVATEASGVIGDT